MERLDSTQGDLHALALKVAVWSREAALLSEGIKEEALLLEIGRQADRLAASEAQRREARKQERVYRLSMENCELRRELRDLIRIVKLLLDRRALDRERELERALAAEASAGGGGGGGSRFTTPTRRTPLRRKAWEDDAAAAVPAPPTPRANLPYFSASYAAAAPSTPRARRGYSYGGSYDSYSISAGLEGLTDENAPYFVAADRAQADADAVLSRLAARRAAAGASRSGGGGGTHYEREIAAQRELFEREMSVDRKQVNSALAAMDQAVQELTLGFQSRNRSAGGGSGGGSAAAVPQAWAAAGPRSAAPSFGGFLPGAGEVVSEVTPAVPEGWRRRARSQEEEQEAEAESRRQAEVERVRMRLAVAERELAEAVAEAAEAEAAEDAAEAAEAAVAEEAAEAEEEAAVLGTPTKLAASVPVPAPPTPIYQGVSYGVPVRGGGAGSVASYSRLHYSAGGFGGGGGVGRAPLDSMLTVEVDKLKRINKALATTLVSYNRVASRLGDVAAEVAAPMTAFAVATPTAAGNGTARALFTTSSPGGGGISLAAVPPPPAQIDAASVATTYASSVHTAVPFGYTPSYPLGVSTRAVAAPSTPPAAARYLRPEEGRVVSWAPSLVTSPPSRERPYAVGGGAAAETRRLHSALDTQLYAIRQQLQALRTDMVADRLAALAASAPGGGSAATAASPLATTPYRDAAKLTRLEEELSELRRQVQRDRLWYHDSLDCVVSERSAAFRDLQRRIDRLMNNGI